MRSMGNMYFPIATRDKSTANITCSGKRTKEFDVFLRRLYSLVNLFIFNELAKDIEYQISSIFYNSKTMH